jgi:hypothetical protein
VLRHQVCGSVHWKAFCKTVSGDIGLGLETVQAGNRVINWPSHIKVAHTCDGPLRNHEVQDLWTA